MGLFSRTARTARTASTASTESRIPAAEEVAAAGRALARGNSKPADRLCDEAGPHSQAVAMQIIGISVDYTPQD
ncbi:hypothetical protein [Streptomyces sp. NBC_00932]|uniref:hypothetical protein n=1 Tax=Streptomyces sp. NBC_00932 TaxID=2903690 RepID=UPI003867875A|nr:hypothetical protein OG221_27730 [Streptomyces sp. NBC_00932]